jgi:hypothetical protein
MPHTPPLKQPMRTRQAPPRQLMPHQQPDRMLLLVLLLLLLQGK